MNWLVLAQSLFNYKKANTACMKNRKMLFFLLATVLFHIVFFWKSYDTFYGFRSDLAAYQTIEDQNHNKTTQDQEICMAQAVINHAINWKNLCRSYLLPDSCGLPQANYNALKNKLEDETNTCKVNHQYTFPSRVGPSVDSSGNMVIP